MNFKALRHYASAHLIHETPCWFLADYYEARSYLWGFRAQLCILFKTFSRSMTVIQCSLRGSLARFWNGGHFYIALLLGPGLWLVLRDACLYTQKSSLSRPCYTVTRKMPFRLYFPTSARFIVLKSYRGRGRNEYKGGRLMHWTGSLVSLLPTNIYNNFTTYPP